MEFQDKHTNKINEIKNQIEQVIDVELGIKRKSFSKEEFNQIYFCKIIDNIEFLFNRTQSVLNTVKIDLIDYEEPFYETLEMLLEMNFSKEEMEIINYYLYGRYDDKGNQVPLVDSNNDITILETSEDLWNVIQELKK